MPRLFKNNDIVALADIISENNMTQIQRKIAEITVNLRQSKSNALRKNIRFKLHQFEIASSFRQLHPTLADEWRCSLSCFQELTDFFLDKVVDEPNKSNESNAIRCWYLQLMYFIPEDVDASQIIVLGNEFCSEPIKFLAFLYWLLSKKVPFEKIIASNLLHHYFFYHVIDIDVITQTYAKLKNFSTLSKNFLKSLSRVSCEMIDKVNNKEENNQFRSMNLVGKFFIHDNESLIREHFTNKNMFLYQVEENSGEKLYSLFGWTLLKSLNYSAGGTTNTGLRGLENIINKIVQSTVAEKFFTEFQQYALNGDLEKNFVHEIFYILEDDNIIKLIDVNGLVQKHPFYLHLRNDIVVLDTLKSAVKKITEQNKYHTLAHVFLLVPLYLSLTTLDGDLLNYDDEKSSILETIFKIVFFSPVVINDDVYGSISEILCFLKSFFFAELVKYEKNINNEIARYATGGSDYDSVLRLWGEQLEKINLIRYFYPEVNENRLYPWSKYHLITQCLELAHNHAQIDHFTSLWSAGDEPPESTQEKPKAKPFLPLSLIHDMGIVNEEDILYTIQEVFCLTRCFSLVKSIVEEVLQKNDEDFIIRFFHKPFSNGKTMLCRIPFSASDLQRLVHTAMKKNRLSIVKLLCGFVDTTNPVIKTNNIMMFLDVMEDQQCPSLFSEDFNRKMNDCLMIKNNHGETLLHLAVNSLNNAIFQRYIKLFDRYLSEGVRTLLYCESDSGQIPHAEGDSMVAKTINEQLEKLRKKYPQSRIMPNSAGFFSPVNDSKREREDERQSQFLP